MFTILLVFALFYIGYTIYRTREDTTMTPMEVFVQTLNEPAYISHAYLVGTRVGPIGDFGSYDWKSDELKRIVE